MMGPEGLEEGGGKRDDMGKVFIGGLSRETTTRSLRAYFEWFGDISDVVVMKDRSSGVPRGFGFVTYANQIIADHVIANRHVVDGKEVEAKPAVPREAGAGLGHARRAAPRPYTGAGPGCGALAYTVRVGLRRLTGDLRDQAADGRRSRYSPLKSYTSYTGSTRTLKGTYRIQYNESSSTLKYINKGTT